MFKQIIAILFITFSSNAYSIEYNCEPDPIDFNVGDVISSEIFQGIVEKINRAIVGMTQSELNTSWSCMSILRPGGASGSLNGYSANADDLYTQTQTLTFNAVTSNTSRVIYQNNLGQGFQTTPAQDCTVRLVGSRLHWVNSSGGSCGYNQGMFDIQKKSDTCMVFTQINDSSTVCNKLNAPPDAPLNLLATLNNSTNFQTLLIWTAGDDATIGYDIKRKTTVNGTYSSIGTTNLTTYTDTTVAANNTYWYQVFATNVDGTSTGSNIRQASWNNTPPSFDIASTVSVYEGQTNILTMNVSDVENHSLTYSIANQSPGNDATYISISSVGQLTFKALPDYETPLDYGSNNIYDITISVSDGFDTVNVDLGIVVLDQENQ
jgi:hypothetical protein